MCRSFFAIHIYEFTGLYQTQPFPIGAAEQHDESEADERQRDTAAHEVTHLKGVRAVGNHVLRRVDRQDEAEADNVLQNHGHADDIDARSFELLQDGNDNRNDSRGKTGGAGKAHMHDNQNQCHDCQNRERGGVCKVEGGDDYIRQPGGSLRRQQCAAQGDADAEEDNCTPVNFVDNLVPLHNADFGQHKQGDSDHRCGGGVNYVQLFLCRP